jgi:dual specificity MAP kinase phosphatase
MTDVTQYLRSWLLARRIEGARLVDHGWRILSGQPTASRSMITPQVYLGGQYRRRSARWFERHGITAIVSMRLHPPVEFGALPGIEILHLPTRDYHAPTLSQLREGADFIGRHVDAGGKVYVHCHHGEGRGPTMVAAYLVHRGMTPEDALLAIRQVRTFIRPTREQLDRLNAFAAEAGRPTT